MFTWSLVWAIEYHGVKRKVGRHSVGLPLHRPYACRWQIAVERENRFPPAKISRRFLSSKFSLFYFLFIIWISNTIFTAGDNQDSIEWDDCRKYPIIHKFGIFTSLSKKIRRRYTPPHPATLPIITLLSIQYHCIYKKQILIVTLSP